MANKIYATPETPIVFSPGTGTAISLASLANGAGRISARYDRGSGAKPMRYRWQARTRSNVAPTVGMLVRLYLVTGQDGTYEDGGFGSGDIAIASEDLLRNVQLIGAVIADQASTTKDFVRSGIITIAAQYLRVAWWNATGQALHATGTNHEFTLVPYPEEIQ